MSGLILFILSLILANGFIIPGILYKIIKSGIKSKTWKEFEISIGKYFRELAISLDQYGNVFLGPMMNDILIRGKDKYLFGNPDNTVSLVIAMNLKRRAQGKDVRVTKVAKFIIKIVRKLDKGHFKKTLINPEDN